MLKKRSFASNNLKILPTLTFKSEQIAPEKIIFMHVPKTGGTNLHYLAQALEYTGKKDFYYYRFAVPRKENVSPCLLYPGWRGGLDTIEATNPLMCATFNFISGHFPFDLNALPWNNFKFITLIRNPIDRALSLTNFDIQRGYIGKSDALNYALKCEIDNPQTRAIAGAEWMFGICTQETLDRAKSNIENYFMLAGVTEDTNGFMQVLASILRWKPCAIVQSQVTAEKVLPTFPDDVVKSLKEKYKYDLELYTWVKERWEAWKARNIVEVNFIPYDLKLMCITHEFASTREPVFMDQEEIMKHNNHCEKEYSPIQQIENSQDV
ncbi:MAG TPA: hypothetical protein VFP93_03065, partial [Gammaproteobacteria bacterium]|nr:hypothetical protein [Gammaproteobacteria bacterium]